MVKFQFNHIKVDLHVYSEEINPKINAHNFTFYEEAIEKAEYYVYSHDYILKQVIDKDTYTVLHSIDEMVKSSNPIQVFEKYKPLFKRLSNVKNENETIENKFF